MPLFKLFPGLPKRSFFSSSFFLGGIFFRRVEYLQVKIYETGKEEKFVRERKRSLPEDSSKGVFGEVKKERDHKRGVVQPGGEDRCLSFPKSLLEARQMGRVVESSLQDHSDWTSRCTTFHANCTINKY